VGAALASVRYVIPDRAFCFKTDFSLNLLRLIVYNTMIKKEAFVTIKDKEKKKSQTFLEKNGLMCTHIWPNKVFRVARNQEKWDYARAAIAAFNAFCAMLIVAKVEGRITDINVIGFALNMGVIALKIFGGAGMEQKCVIIPTVMDEVRSGPHQKLFHPNDKFNGKVDAAHNFARGHHSNEMDKNGGGTKRSRTTQELLFEIFLRVGSG